MYDELVKQLRDEASKRSPCSAVGLMCGEAADAIHRLSYQANDWEKIADEWRKRYEELERRMREEKI